MEENQGQLRVRLPRKNEVFGIVYTIYGAKHFEVRCSDGKIRFCRIPKSLAKNVRVREQDLVLVEPWPIEGDKKGDIVWKYTKVESEWLKEKGFLKDL
ncbi:MAG: translation initiation factor eIF-1A [archaeon]